MIVSKQEFLTSSGIEAPTLEFWIEQQWLIPARTDAEPGFSDTDVARARLIQDLKGDFGVNERASTLFSISSINFMAYAGR